MSGPRGVRPLVPSADHVAPSKRRRGPTRPSAPVDGFIGAGPVRTCIGCRLRLTVGSLLRIVADPAAPGFVVGPHLPGRGAWLCRSSNGAEGDINAACLAAALKRNAFRRAFRL